MPASAADTPLVAHNELWHYRKGTSAPQPDWKTAGDASLDSSWLTGNGGFGYADNAAETQLCQTLLNDMRTNYWTLAMRRSFQITSEVDAKLHLRLTMDYDDGFIAWLDGVHLTGANSPGAPAEPAYNALATGTHESSRGNSSPRPPVIYDLGAVGARLPAGTHVLAILGLNQTNSSDFVQIADLALVAAPTGGLSGTIAVDTTWSAANSPYVVAGNLTVAAGATLTLEPGVVVELGAGVNFTVDGRLLAEGNETDPIRFTRAAGASTWGGITINGGVGSPESRMSFAHLEFNGATAIHSVGGTVFLDHLTFGSSNRQYLSLDNSSFVVSHCVFPTASAAFELVHGAGGIKNEGRGIFRRNFFGATRGYNDSVDFTGGNRPAPVVHFINNVFIGTGDDLVDLDGTDAWIEGNLFLHAHKNGSPDSSSAISGGNDGSRTSEITVLGNIFYDCDHAATAKQGNFYTLINNTIVRQTRQGGTDSDGAVVNFADEGTSEGAGMYLEGNVIYDAEKLVRNLTSAIVTFTNNLLPFAWSGPGGGNSAEEPLLKHIPQLSETVFTNWDQAQVMRDWFSLLPGSPALGTGPNGLDRGGVIPPGASVSGEPEGVTNLTSATLIVGGVRAGNGIPVAGWPNGSGYTHYRWRLDTNEWNAETPITTPISLTGLADGPHRVEVVGNRDSSLYQNDPDFGSDALVTGSRTWTVQTSVQPPRIDTAQHFGDSIRLSFAAVAGATYSVQYRDAFDAAHDWSNLTNVVAEPGTAVVQVTDWNVTANRTRFYRLVTPAHP